MSAGILVRVKPDVEKLVRKMADRLGYYEFTVRNTAILLGLLTLAGTEWVPRTDKEFEDLIERVKKVIE